MQKIKIVISTGLLFLLWNFSIIGQATSFLGKKGCMSCEELKNLRLPDVLITEAVAITETSVHCKILGTISKEINFELLLPERWNERFVMGGGGGFVGSIANMARSKVNEGYATAGTDTGHKGSGIKADWALDNMERQVNFGHLAVHRTAAVAKHLIYRYYCSDPAYSYFIGCSRGGGQAMMEAQRYPEDFDGIVAGAPAFNWPAIGAEFIQNIQLIYPDPKKLDEPVITKDNLQLLQSAVLKQCDNLDGIADQIINDPRDCSFDFSVLPICPANAAEKNCFTSQQLKVIKAIYKGAENREGKIYAGFPLGGENEPGGWAPWITGPNQGTMALNFPSLQFAFGTEMFKYLVFQDPNWDYTAYDFSNFAEDTRYASAYLDATSTNYSALKNRGGKMIIYHGWNDPALSALATIEHYKEVEKNDANLRDYLRLFMLPGVLHCGGGPGPDQTDWIELIRDWVENGKAPERVIVSKRQNDETIITRPVFPYPRKAIYNGKGDPNKESSFN